ncbi:MAG: ATP-binding protein [Deltaproteobacteria bacterium]|nr:ATP-binding protein [Deltaproteobacteria bacterium]
MSHKTSSSATKPAELVIISGKGGTGKTSITASLAMLAEKAVLADCDVDAADLHLILTPEVENTHTFTAGREAVIRQEDCTSCGACLENCRFDGIYEKQGGDGKPHYFVDDAHCEGCGVCVHFCPAKAIDFPERVCGEWYVSRTRKGPMVHARLGIGAENSGKLVSTVRREAMRIAAEGAFPLVIVDGPPGIGCPVIASVTGASLVLVVTEPTLSGEHDLSRVLKLTEHFGIPTAVCVNKWDLNPDMAERIETRAQEAKAYVAGRVRYDSAVTSAQIEEKAVVETDSASADDIRNLWSRLRQVAEARGVNI